MREVAASEDIIAILSLIDHSSCDEVRLEIGGFKLHVRKAPATHEKAAIHDTEFRKAQPESESRTAPPPPIAPTAPVNVPSSNAAIDGAVVAAPMVGTFYRAPAPDAAPFVQVGDFVTAETVVCIIEVMKVMNTVKAGASGKVVEIPVNDGDLVEFGQRLLTILPETR